MSEYVIEEDEEDIVRESWPEGKEENDTQRQFREDMEEARFDVQFYRGRWFYRGWSVKAKDFRELQDIIRATRIYLQWEELGKTGFIIWPED